MLSEARNRQLTEIGPGTPMGNLMRRYWQPIAAAAELDEHPTKPVRLMGEDLVLYRDLSGNYGLVDRHCPHRRADLSYGFVEQCGLRCNYHGWLFDATGRCLEQPFEDQANPAANFKAKIKVKAYPVEEKAGLLWAYLGPLPAPLVPNWEPFTWQNGFRQIVFSEIPCNWLQCQENSIDPVHFEWMHDNWSVRLSGRDGPYAPKHLKIAFDEFDWGIAYRRIREDTSEDSELWTVGRVCLWPNALFTADHFEWRVPVDDTTTLSVSWIFNRVPRDREPYVQNSVPYWYGPIKDPRTGRWISTHVDNQDFIAWVGQGTIADRTQEHLGTSDRGIAMLRQRFLNDMDVVAQGGDPKAIVRDPQRNQCIALPIVGRDRYVEGYTREELDAHTGGRLPATPRSYVYQAGQPEAVRKAYEEAMGFKMEDHVIIVRR